MRNKERGEGRGEGEKGEEKGERKKREEKIGRGREARGNLEVEGFHGDTKSKWM